MRFLHQLSTLFRKWNLYAPKYEPAYAAVEARFARKYQRAQLRLRRKGCRRKWGKKKFVPRLGRRRRAKRAMAM